MKTKLFLCGALGISIFFATSPCLANPAIDRIANCMIMNTTEKDKVYFSKYMFFIMAKHPLFKGMSVITDEEIETTNRKLAMFIENFYTKSCRKEVLAATSSERASANAKALQIISGLAMQNILQDKNVDAAGSEFLKYVDINKVKEVMHK